MAATPLTQVTVPMPATLSPFKFRKALDDRLHHLPGEQGHFVPQAETRGGEVIFLLK